jgi:hypothetical protein
MACDTFLTMLALPVLYPLFGKGSRSDVRFEEGNAGVLATVGHQLQAAGR